MHISLPRRRRRSERREKWSLQYLLSRPMRRGDCRSCRTPQCREEAPLPLCRCLPPLLFSRPHLWGKWSSYRSIRANPTTPDPPWPAGASPAYIKLLSWLSYSLSFTHSPLFLSSVFESRQADLKFVGESPIWFCFPLLSRASLSCRTTWFDSIWFDCIFSAICAIAVV